MSDALVLERVAVRPGRLSILVRVASWCPRQTNDALASYALAHYPALPHHVCINGEGSTFGAVLAHTSVAHLLEHVIIDEQVADPRTPRDVALLGTTEWTDERAGIARIEVNFSDDLVALQALRTALAFLNKGLEGHRHEYGASHL